MSDTKICKQCKNEIHKKASVCPNCNKKQGGITKFVIIAIVVILFIGALTQNNNDTNTDDGSAVTQVNNTKEPKDDTPSTKKDATPTPTPVPVKTSFTIGETASQKDIDVTLLGVTESKGSQFNKPSDGNVFVLCEFEIVNNSKKDIAVSSMLSFETYCDDYSTTISIGAILEKGDKSQLDGSVAAGKKMKGIIGYEVPEDWSELEISFNPNFWTGKDIKFVATK